MNRISITAEPGTIERQASRAPQAGKFSLDLLSIAPVHDPVTVAVRREQVRQLFRATPRSQLIVLITVVLLAWELRHSVSTASLSMWLVATCIVSLCRAVQARQVGRTLAKTLPLRIVRDITLLVLLVLLAAMLRVVPAFL